MCSFNGVHLLEGGFSILLNGSARSSRFPLELASKFSDVHDGFAEIADNSHHLDSLLSEFESKRSVLPLVLSPELVVAALHCSSFVSAILIGGLAICALLATEKSLIFHVDFLGFFQHEMIFVLLGLRFDKLKVCIGGHEVFPLSGLLLQFTGCLPASENVVFLSFSVPINNKFLFMVRCTEFLDQVSSTSLTLLVCFDKNLVALERIKQSLSHL